MDSAIAFCPNQDCYAKGQTGMGNIQIHSRKQKRYSCKEFGKTFTETALTPFNRLRHSQELFVIVVTLLAFGCPVQAIVAALSLDKRTVSDWQKRAATQSRRVHHHLVEKPRDLREVQRQAYWGCLFVIRKAQVTKTCMKNLRQFCSLEMTP